MRRNTLDTFLRRAGESYEILRDTIVQKVKGLPNEMPYDGVQRQCVQFKPDVDIREGDILIRVITGEKWVVEKVDPFVLDGQIDFFTVFYSDKKRREAEKAQSVSYTFHNSSNIIAGNQTTAIINVSMDKIREEIETRGGEDKQELLNMVNEIKQIFEKKETISKNSLAKFSEILERHSWLTGSLVQLIGSTALQFLIK